MKTQIKLVKAMVLGIALMLPNLATAKEYIVQYKSEALGVDFSKVEVLEHYEKRRMVLVGVPAFKEAMILAHFLADPSVVSISENFTLHSLYRHEEFMESFKANRSGDFLGALVGQRAEWSDEKIKSHEAHDFMNKKGLKDKSRKIKVAVIDTGVDQDHFDLKPNMDRALGKDFADKDDNPHDDVGPRNPGHGTHVAGIVGATGLVENGVIGINPYVSMIALKFLGSNGQGNLLDAIAAIDYCIENKVDIISASWGAKVPESAAGQLIEAVKRAADAGIMFVAAAGNDGASNDNVGFYPANVLHPNVIAVAASDSNDGKPQWSNYGSRYVDLAAPGDKIMSTLPSQKYRNLSGTSMAAPAVSGLASLMMMANPNLDPAQLKALMQYSGAQVDIDVACNCRIDSLEAVKVAANPGFYIVPATAGMKFGETLQLATHGNFGGVTYKIIQGEGATIDEKGLITAGEAEAEFVVQATDADGNVTQTLTMRVNEYKNTGGGGGFCPFKPEVCEGICLILPIIDIPELEGIRQILCGG